MSICVVLVGAREELRASLAASRGDLSDIQVAATADSDASALLQAERVAAQVVLVAAPLPGWLPEVCDALHVLEAQPKVLVLDGAADEDTLLSAIEAGVDGYVAEVGGVADVAEAVRSVVRGEAVIPPSMLGPLLRRLIQRRREATNAAERLVELTRREREVLHLMVAGRDPYDIASTLFISPETAKTHVQRVLRKLGVHSRHEAIALVTQMGLADRLEAIVERSAS